MEILTLGQELEEMKAKMSPMELPIKYLNEELVKKTKEAVVKEVKIPHTADTKSLDRCG